MVSRLLERAIVTIQNLREQAGIPAEGMEPDALINLRHAAEAPGEMDAAIHASALLSASDMIRTLHIVLQNGAGIHLKPGEDH